MVGSGLLRGGALGLQGSPEEVLVTALVAVSGLQRYREAEHRDFGSQKCSGLSQPMFSDVKSFLDGSLRTDQLLASLPSSIL